MSKLLNSLKEDLIKKYNVNGPYYTSYPILSEWSEQFADNDYKNGLTALCSGKQELPLFLYIHFPFCAKQCYYCICNSTITYNHSTTRNFLTHLSREIDMFYDFFKKRSFIPKVKMVHIGGGTPNLMNEEEFEFLLKQIRKLVNLKDLNEFAMEIDPRTVNKQKLKYYSDKGVNRISFGIQDFDTYVQKAINRTQSFEMVDQLLSPEIRKHFKSINFDILYGLPLQSRETFRKTIENVKKLSPDRITLLKYAHVPERIKHQRLIKKEDIPNYIDSTLMFVESIDSLVSAGYEYIGIDHFAKSSDSLARANKNKTLWRNFLGVSPGGMHNTIGIGVTSTSSVNDYYAQNVYSVEEYYQSIKKNVFPIFRGFKLSTDDLIRREIIHSIICNYCLDFADIERKYKIKFKEYFRKEMNLLKYLEEDNMIKVYKASFKVTSLGRVFIRHICKVFDKFTRNKKCKVFGP
ncbi:oxygen-independent coproporphyrinogen III oxidase [bacterium]|nr:oxygen-independent coproporphyrinogen III oxidase [bacterium]